MSTVIDDSKSAEPKPWNLTFDEVTSFFIAKGVTPKCIVCGSAAPKIHTEDEGAESLVSLVAWRKVEAALDQGASYAMKAVDKYLPGVAVECGGCGNIQIYGYGAISDWAKNKKSETPKDGE